MALLQSRLDHLRQRHLLATTGQTSLEHFASRISLGILTFQSLSLALRLVILHALLSELLLAGVEAPFKEMRLNHSNVFLNHRQLLEYLLVLTTLDLP